MSSEERRGATAAADVWNERYALTRQVWSGERNATLVAELEGVAPGRALDVGFGEGTDRSRTGGPGRDASSGTSRGMFGAIHSPCFSKPTTDVWA